MANHDRDLDRELDNALQSLIPSTRSRVNLLPASEVRMLANKRPRQRIAAIGASTTLALALMGGAAFALEGSISPASWGSKDKEAKSATTSQASESQTPEQSTSASSTAPAKEKPAPGTGTDVPAKPGLPIPDVPSIPSLPSDVKVKVGAKLTIGTGSLITVPDLKVPGLPAVPWVTLPALDLNRTIGACGLTKLQVKAPNRTISVGFELDARRSVVEELAQYSDAKGALVGYTQVVDRLERCLTKALVIGDVAKVKIKTSLPGIGNKAFMIEVSHSCKVLCPSATSYSVALVNNVVVLVRHDALLPIEHVEKVEVVKTLTTAVTRVVHTSTSS